jgi:hypothetical protein
MADKKPEPTQKTRPKEGKPIEIPVRKRGERKGLAPRPVKG